MYHHRFQSTLPQGERLICVTDCLDIVPFQSTLPQGERRASVLKSSFLYSISIHAPTRGATSLPSRIPTASCEFQSTLPQGERRNMRCGSPGYCSISIHAPTRGATTIDIARNTVLKNFNPRSHKGSDNTDPITSAIVPNFNPRSHKGSDPGYAVGKIIDRVFQSTLPQGERQQFYTKFHICFISFLPILSPYHISTHSPLPTFNHFLYIFSGANRPEISCLLPFRTKTIFGIL